LADSVLWAGGYTTLSDAPTTGISALARAADGSLRFVGVAVQAPDPSYLLSDPRDDDLVYAVDEGGRGVQSFRRMGEHSLESIGRVETGGEYPCHLGFRRNPSGAAFLDVACYGDGAIVVHPISESGVLGEPVQVLEAPAGRGPLPAQEGPHAHSTLSVGGHVLSADLGTDQVHVHAPLADGRLERIASLRLPAGTGPRDLVVSPSGDVWVLGEHGCTVTVLRMGESGFSVGESVPLLGDDAESVGDQAAGLSFSEDGSHANAGLRGSNRIAVLALASGVAPRPVGAFSAGGNWPRHHALDGDVLHVANERSGTITSFRLAPSGTATPIGPPAAVPAPTFLLPAAR
jgi:6-phosphogluconolactonase